MHREQARGVRLRARARRHGARAHDARRVRTAHLASTPASCSTRSRAGRSRWRCRTTRRCAMLADPARPRARCDDMRAADRRTGLRRASRTGRSTSSTRRSRPRTSSTRAGRSATSRRSEGKEPFDALLRHRRRRRAHAPASRRPTAAPTTTRLEGARRVWRDPRAVVGASDAGAHLDFLATFNYSTALLGKAVRERGLLADRGGGATPHRRPGPAVRAHASGAGSPRAGTPTSSCSTRATIGPGNRCACASTCPAARRACTARPRASSTCSSTASRSSTTASSPTRGPAGCCGPAATPRRVTVPGGAG